MVKHGIGRVPPPKPKLVPKQKTARQRVKARADRALYVAKGRTLAIGSTGGHGVGGRKLAAVRGGIQKNRRL